MLPSGEYFLGRPRFFLARAEGEVGPSCWAAAKGSDEAKGKRAGPGGIMEEEGLGLIMEEELVGA